MAWSLPVVAWSPDHATTVVEAAQPVPMPNADTTPADGGPRTEQAPVDIREQLPVGPASRAGLVAEVSATSATSCDAYFAAAGEQPDETWA